MAGITDSEKALAKAVWIEVEKDYDAVGRVLFTELFSAYPDYAKHFEKLKSSPNDDLLESPRFLKHMVSALFPAISQMLKNLDDPGELAAQLKEIGVNHKKRRLTRANFEAIHKIILLTLKKMLTDSFSSETEAAWNKILTIAFDKISAEL